MRGVGATASLFPVGKLKNATDVSHGNSVEFNQSDDDFETLEVFLIFVCHMYQTFTQQSLSMTSKAETLTLAMFFQIKLVRKFGILHKT